MRTIRLVLSLALLCSLCACASLGMGALNVAHLQKSKWVTDSSGTVEMKFFTIDYASLPLGDEVGVRSEASVHDDELPQWVTWLDTLDFSVYLCEADGTVLDSRSVKLLPRSRKDAEHMHFEVVFDSDLLNRSGVFVTFGYSMKGYKDQFKQGIPFFAQEDAVSR